jgi:hypothetical protein
VISIALTLWRLNSVDIKNWNNTVVNLATSNLIETRNWLI